VRTETMIILGLVAVAAVGTAISAFMANAQTVVTPPPSGGTTDTQAGLAFAGGLLGTIGDVVTDII
jgi:hypothetical protein